MSVGSSSGTSNSRTAFREEEASRSSSTRLPLSSMLNTDRPVMFPPGRASEATKPEPTGSAVVAKTIGMVCVTRLSAATAGVEGATISSTFCLTSEAASSGSSLVVFGQTAAMAMVRPST